MGSYANGGVVHAWGGVDLGTGGGAGGMPLSSGPSKSGAGGAGGAVLGGMAGPLGALAGGGIGSGSMDLKSLAQTVADPGGFFKGSLGEGFDKPQLANVQQGTNVGDVQNAQARTGNSLQAQQNLLNALQGQNGLGAQSALSNQLQAANGIGTQNQAIQGLQGTAGMYQNIAQGKGPNVAQSMLNQQTGQNVANQAALMAGQRGAGANVGLMARQAAQQGANTQQQAVGQGATMQAQQQQNALAGLANTQQAFGNMGGAQAGMQQGLANQMAGQQIGATNANTQANLANQQQMQQALQGINTSNVAAQGNVNTGNAALLQTGMQGKQGIMGGVMGGLGNIGGTIFGGGGGGGAAAPAGGGGAAPAAWPELMAQGGEIQNYADGNMVDATPDTSTSTPPNGPSSSFGQFLQNNNNKSDFQTGVDESSKLLSSTGDNKSSQDLQLIGTVASMLSKGGIAKSGGKVVAKKESQEPVKKGDSYSNDRVPAMLSAGEVVIPRSVMQSKDPVRASADFVSKVLAKRRAK